MKTCLNVEHLERENQCAKFTKHNYINKDMINMEEIWKDIPEWKDLYEVSNLGNIRSKRTGKLRVLGTNNCGYKTIRLYDSDRIQKFFVHRLVAMMFLEEDDYTKQVNHIDCDKTNNRVDNLEWVTQSENEIHAIKNGLVGVWRGYFKVEYDNGTIEYHDNQTAFAQSVGVSKTTVRYWLQGKYPNSYRKRGIREICFCDKSSTTSENK